MTQIKSIAVDEIGNYGYLSQIKAKIFLIWKLYNRIKLIDLCNIRIAMYKHKLEYALN